MPPSTASGARIGPRIWRGTRGFSASRRATPRASRGSNRRGIISACISKPPRAKRPRRHGRSSSPPASTGGGGRLVPEVLTRDLPASLYAHTEDAIDFAALAGKDGGGDRRRRLGLRRRRRGAGARRRGGASVRPPRRDRRDADHALARVSRRLRPLPPTAGRRPLASGDPLPPRRLHPHHRRDRAHGAASQLPSAFVLALGRRRGWRTADVRPPRSTARGIVSISSSPAPAIPPISPRVTELRDFAGDILLWRDRYAPPADERDEVLGAHPYLGAGHELLERTPGAAPLLRHIHVQNPAGFVSFGLPIGDVPSMKRDIPAIVAKDRGGFVPG